MADRHFPSSLTKEVLPPQNASNGVAVLVVASLTMLLAVTSSALALRARMVHSHCSAPAAHVVIPQPVILEWVPAKAEECGKGVKRVHPDGSWSMDYRPCPDAEAPFFLRSAQVPQIYGLAGTHAAAPAAGIPEGIEVRRIR